jgi:tetratricopeptide (TPR) repeat protein
MRAGRALIAATVAASAATVALLGGVLAERGEPGAAPAATPPPAVAAEQALSGFSQGDTAGAVAALEAKAESGTAAAQDYTLLGLAYQQRARETADPGFYTLSEQALREALRLAPGDVLSTSGLASLALSRHRFRDALGLGLRARRLAPGLARPYGIVGDALVELGRYEEAFRAFDRMAALKPSLAAYARISYARELLGDTRGAIAAMRLALGPALGQAEPTAWTHVQLGKLHWSRGRVEAARREYLLALRAFPGYVYALDALARAEAARGDLPKAIALARRATASVPLPELLATLGDLLAVAGRPDEARAQYRTVGAIERLLVANGVRTDLETALFNVDHGLRLRESLAQARAARGERRSIQADDVLAWALARNGRCHEALAWSKRSLRLGTEDASMFFHRGAIERCLGREGEARGWFARALALNPNFSLVHAPIAREALR